MGKFEKIIEELKDPESETSKELETIINEDPVKQIIVVRKDLLDRENEKMTCGKLAAQVSHASMAPILEKMRGGMTFDMISPTNENYRLFLDLKVGDPLKDWLEGSFRKVILYVKNESQLIKLHEQLKADNITTCLIKDSGFTIFSEPTITCLGIEPLRASVVDKYTKRLRLLNI